MSRWKKEHVTGEIGGLKCLEPAGRQKTNDDDQKLVYTLRFVFHSVHAFFVIWTETSAVHP